MGASSTSTLKMLSTRWSLQSLYSRSLDSASREVLTASDSSIGSSGGTTDVRISVHSRNSLYLLRSGFSEPDMKLETKRKMFEVRGRQYKKAWCGQSQVMAQVLSLHVH